MKTILHLLFISFLLLKPAVTLAMVDSDGGTIPTPTCGPPFPTPFYVVPVPGMNCGVAGNTCNNMDKCCAYEKITPPLVNFSFPFDVVSAWINDRVKDKLNPILESQRLVDVPPCYEGSPSIPGDLGNPACKCIVPTPAPLAELKPLCEKLKKTDGSMDEVTQCENCLSGNNPYKSVGIWTGVGCIYGNVKYFIEESLLKWGIGFAGGISLLCIMYAAFMMQTSSGNPEKIKKAQQLMTSCIMGLMLILFSVFILKLIGVDILKIPGFGS